MGFQRIRAEWNFLLVVFLVVACLLFQRVVPIFDKMGIAK